MKKNTVKKTLEHVAEVMNAPEAESMARLAAPLAKQLLDREPASYSSYVDALERLECVKSYPISERTITPAARFHFRVFHFSIVMIFVRKKDYLSKDAQMQFLGSLFSRLVEPPGSGNQYLMHVASCLEMEEKHEGLNIGVFAGKVAEMLLGIPGPSLLGSPDGLQAIQSLVEVTEAEVNKIENSTAEILSKLAPTESKRDF